MRKIPTLFKRDPDDMRRVLPEVTPGCEWVLAGEGVPTRKYDGTCVMFDGEEWWARREVKPGKQPPENFRPISTDESTGKTVGWEPIGQSPFAKFHDEAWVAGPWLNDPSYPHFAAGTYELLGPKINGNPEQRQSHTVVRHSQAEHVSISPELLTYQGLRGTLTDSRWIFEGIVWHHPDGRMAKLKRRDFPQEPPR